MRRGLIWLAARRWPAAGMLLALCLVTYLPGVLLLPAVDRTEIVFASASRDMLAAGNLTDPRFRGEALRGKPAGTFWAQMATAAGLGEGTRDAIATYRLPSLIGVTIAVMATFWLLAPLLGVAAAFIAGALFAVAPIVALEANLAVADGVALAPAVLAQLALLRVYCASPGTNVRWLALMFWAAQGVGMTVNALAVPLLSLSTIAALFVFERRLDWMRRLQPFWGVPLMLALGAPWLVARAAADGGMPFAGMMTSELLAALGGSQADKWKAAPLSFTLAFVLGFLPGALLLWPASKRIWADRASLLPKFLLAWMIGYLVFLELISGKPALYSVQPMFPAAAAAVAMLLLRRGVVPAGLADAAPHPNPLPAGGERGKDGAIPSPHPSWGEGQGEGQNYAKTHSRAVWSYIPAAFIVAVYGGLIWATDAALSLLIFLGCALVAAGFWAAAEARRLGFDAAWLAASVTGFAVFLAFTFGMFLPHLEQAWPAQRLATATASLKTCVPGRIGIIGLREPSATFVLGSETRLADATEITGWVADRRRAIAIVEDRWHQAFVNMADERRVMLPERVGCVDAFNVMRGCPLRFSIYVTGRDGQSLGCEVPAQFRCSAPPPVSEPSSKERSRCQ